MLNLLVYIKKMAGDIAGHPSGFTILSSGEYHSDNLIHIKIPSFTPIIKTI